MASSDVDLKEQFESFSKFGNSKSEGKTITLSNSDKWMKQAKVIDGKKITTTDTGICFNKMKSKTLNYTDYMKFIDDLANYKKVNVDELKNKLTKCGLPGTNHTTDTVKGGAVDRLTDTSAYTGTHKERFDESGKGKGKVGREDISHGVGYVSGYKNANNYDATHK